MKRYADHNGNSGIRGYETGDDFIVLWFNDSSEYTYTYESAGARHIKNMKKLAAKGEGLNTYLNKYVKDKFER